MEPPRYGHLSFFFVLAPVVVTVSLFQDLSGFLPAGMGQVGSTLEAEKLIRCVTASACLVYSTYTGFLGMLSPGKGSGD